MREEKKTRYSPQSGAGPILPRCLYLDGGLPIMPRLHSQMAKRESGEGVVGLIIEILIVCSIAVGLWWA